MANLESLLSEQDRAEVSVEQTDGTVLKFFIRRCHDLTAAEVAVDYEPEEPPVE